MIKLRFAKTNPREKSTGCHFAKLNPRKMLKKKDSRKSISLTYHNKPAAPAFDVHLHVVVYTGTPFSAIIKTTKKSSVVRFLMRIVAKMCFAKRCS